MIIILPRQPMPVVHRTHEVDTLREIRIILKDDNVTVYRMKGNKGDAFESRKGSQNLRNSELVIIQTKGSLRVTKSPLYDATRSPGDIALSKDCAGNAPMRFECMEEGTEWVRIMVPNFVIHGAELKTAKPGQVIQISATQSHVLTVFLDADITTNGNRHTQTHSAMSAPGAGVVMIRANTEFDYLQITGSINDRGPTR